MRKKEAIEFVERIEIIGKPKFNYYDEVEYKW